MSLAHPSDGPSPAASSDQSLVSLVRMRGAPLLDGLETHFPGSREQAEAASSYAFAAAAELGLTRAGAELTREVSKLHDVGRIYVPAEVLAKPAQRRTSEEAILLEGHHELGAQLALGAGIPQRVCDWIRLGAERYDGGGPAGLAGEAIPLQSRISRAAYACRAALADPPEPARGLHGRQGPMETLRGSAGRELDPLVVDALATVLARIHP